MVAGFYAEHVDITLSRGVKGDSTQSYAEPSSSTTSSSQNEGQQTASVTNTPIYSTTSLLPNLSNIGMLAHVNANSASSTIESATGVFRDFSDPNASSSVCGLYNLGNTCFINAGLQCIFSAECFVEFLLEQNLTDFKDYRKGKNGCALSKSLSSLFYNMSTGQYSYVYPRDFYKELSTHFPHLGDFKQHDAQEHLVFLLDKMRDELNPLQGSSSCDNSSKFFDSPTMPEDSGCNDKKRTRLDMEESVAARAWREYLNDNPSHIVKLFQGQYSSKVQCSVCNHTSTQFEPFTILSLPLPQRARLKYITVSWISCPSAVLISSSSLVIRYVVDVNKRGTVGDLKRKCLELMMNDQPLSSQLLMAEIFGGCIRRFLDDHVPVQSLDITKGEIYIFEVPPVPPAAITEQEETQDSVDTLGDNEQLNHSLLDVTMDKQNHDYLNDELLSIEELQLLTRNQNISNSECHQNSQDSTSNAAISTWHSCQICLEEMMDFDLIIHSTCGGSFCKTCKDQLSAYHKDGVLQCPVCSQVVNLSVDFVPMVSQLDKGEIVRNIPVPVLFRFENLSSSTKFTISHHPVVVILPTQVKTSNIYHLISEFLSVVKSSYVEHQIVLVGSQGLYCSRCDFSRKCTGCPLSKDDVLKLKPGDHLAVTLTDNTLYSKLNEVVEHSSVRERKELSITLDDCLACFHEKEELGKDNPWFCSKCNTNQTAERTMSISHYPDALIIHLKRFYFEGSHSDKIDAGVTFSHVFDLSSFGMDKELVSSDPYLVYSLQSIVCHKGTLNSGHYTAYVKNNRKGLDSEWYLINDEVVSKEEPSTLENKYVYILLYQRQSSF